MEEKNFICTSCLWEGNEEEIILKNDLSDNNIGHCISYIESCPLCESEEIEEI